MKFILTGLGNWAANWSLIVDGTQAAEELGFWGVVFPDQYMWDKEDLGVDSYKKIDSTLDVWLALSALAMRTASIRLGTWVTPIPLRPPTLLAKIVSTLDVLSNGRGILGVGAGITRRMFEGYSVWDSPKVRVDKTQEGVELILKLWTASGSVDFQGDYYGVEGAVLEPKPVQKPHPPLLFGGAGKRMLRLAGRYGDICYIPPWNEIDPVEARQVVTREAKKHNRENEVAFAYAYTPLGPEDRYNLKAYVDKVEEAEEKGFDYFITAFAMDAAPWEVTASSVSEISKSYLARLSEFSRNCMASFAK